jgi:hypothetical protein
MSSALAGPAEMTRMATIASVAPMTPRILRMIVSLSRPGREGDGRGLRFKAYAHGATARITAPRRDERRRGLRRRATAVGSAGGATLPPPANEFTRDVTEQSRNSGRFRHQARVSRKSRAERRYLQSASADGESAGPFGPGSGGCGGQVVAVEL